MKHGKNLTVRESNYVKSFRMNPANWLLCKKMADEWELVHRETGRKRTIVAP